MLVHLPACARLPAARTPEGVIATGGDKSEGPPGACSCICRPVLGYLPPEPPRGVIATGGDESEGPPRQVEPEEDDLRPRYRMDREAVGGCLCSHEASIARLPTAVNSAGNAAQEPWALVVFECECKVSEKSRERVALL